MNRKLLFAAAAIGLALGAPWTPGIVFGQSQQSIQVPKFQYDPSFPQPLPEKWAIGAIGGMAVDSHDRGNGNEKRRKSHLHARYGSNER